jgi:hypothetical protein
MTGRDPVPNQGALRMRRSRERRRNGLRCVWIELRETEVDFLIRKGWLKADARNDPHAVGRALYLLFDNIFEVAT